MRCTPILLLAALLAGCSPGRKSPAEGRPSRIEAGTQTAATAQAQIEAAQRQDQAHIDSQLQAVSDSAPAAP